MNRLTPIAFAAATLLAAPPLLAAVDVPLSAAFRIDTPAPFRDPIDPVVARAPDGSMLVVWSADSGAELRARRLAANGAPLGAEFQVASLSNQTQRAAFDVAIDGDGEAVVAWRSDDAPNGRPAIVFRRYAADGSGLGAPTLVDQGEFDSRYGAPAVATDADGDFVIGWTRGQVRVERELDVGIGYFGTTMRLGDRQVRLRRYDRNGNAAGEAQLVATRSDLTLDSTLIGIPINGPAVGAMADLGLLDAVDVAMDADGDHVIAWGGSNFAFAYALVNGRLPYPAPALQTTAIFTRRYDAHGVEQARLPVQVDAAAQFQGIGYLPFGAVNSSPRVAMQPDGGHVVTWTRHVQLALGARDIVQAQRFTANGRRLARNARLATGPSFSGPAPVAVTAAGSGDYVLAWRDRDVIRAARLVAQGRPGGVDDLGDAVTVAVPGDGIVTLGLPTVAADATGNPAVVWHGYDNLQGRNLIFGRLYARP